MIVLPLSNDMSLRELCYTILCDHITMNVDSFIVDFEMDFHLIHNGQYTSVYSKRWTNEN